MAERARHLTPGEAEKFKYSWHLWGHEMQQPPEGDWTTWLMLGGRGAGKTRAGAEWVRALADGERPVSPIALVGETMSEARAIMVEGVSGIISVHPRSRRPRFDAARAMLVWPNGAEAWLMPANDPERFRGPQFAAAWCDELAKWPKAEAAWDMLQFGLRLGDRPRQMVTTTPKPTRLLKRLMAEPTTVITRMKTRANRRNLAPAFLEAVVARYNETVLGRQELDGELVEEMPGALWSRGQIEAGRIGEVPPLSRVVVAVDPPVSRGKNSDACGIVVAGRWGDRAVILADRTVKGTSPVGWARVAVKAFHEFAADTIVVEVNQGGDLVGEVLRQIDAGVPVRAVRASRAKWVRAEPVAALYAQGRVKHAGMFAELEDELCAFGPDGLAEGHSPDRLDALVWGVTELLLRDGPVPRVRV
ncbi:DNA-packaging protein [Pelagibacterium mangrovi]|uniref:DNA-packaging protein n=1 Tax=Pelagibacterium mangrovi TaxID=3119828 RepID=UPI002FCBC6A1